MENTLFRKEHLGQIFLIICLIYTKGVICSSLEDTLFGDLFDDYNRSAQPSSTPGKPVRIKIRLHLAPMQDLISNAEKFMMSAWNELGWNDDRLGWDPESYGGLTKVEIHPNKIWLPNIIQHDIPIQTAFGNDLSSTLFPVTIRNDGTCSWRPQNQLFSRCVTTRGFFPFDEQTCTLEFINSNKDKLLHLSFENVEEAIPDLFADGDDWSMTGTVELQKDGYRSLVFEAKFKRKPLFYVLTMIVPTMVLSILVLMVFRLPPQSGEKMSMGVTLLLSYTVFILMVSENVPHTSKGVPILPVYMMFSFIVACLCVGMEVIILMLYNMKREMAPPNWMSCICCNSKKSKYERVERNNQMNRATRNAGIPMIDNMSKDGNEKVKEADVVMPLLSGILRELKMYRDRQEREDALTEVYADWKDLAVSLDVMFFWGMSAITLVGTLFIFVLLPCF